MGGNQRPPTYSRARPPASTAVHDDALGPETAPSCADADALRGSRITGADQEPSWGGTDIPLVPAAVDSVPTPMQNEAVGHDREGT
jgi:hypothetical protein